MAEDVAVVLVAVQPPAGTPWLTRTANGPPATCGPATAVIVVSFTTTTLVAVAGTPVGSMTTDVTADI
jgi:hypothetical protein